MTLNYVTTNRGKVNSLRKRLEDIEIVQRPLDIPEPRSSDVVEIAVEKAKEAWRILQEPSLVNDSGLYIWELNGFPRAYVNFALDTIGVQGILKLLEGCENRDCVFKECMAYADGNDIHCIETDVTGSLATEEKGALRSYHWSPLAKIFIPQGFSKTHAEMSKKEMDEWYRTKHSSSVDFAQWYLKNVC